MGEYIEIKMLVNALVFSFVGIVLFLFATWLYDKFTPFDLWKEVAEKQNVAVAIMVAAIMIGLAIIIGSAHG